LASFAELLLQPCGAIVDAPSSTLSSPRARAVAGDRRESTCLSVAITRRPDIPPRGSPGRADVIAQIELGDRHGGRGGFCRAELAFTRCRPKFAACSRSPSILQLGQASSSEPTSAPQSRAGLLAHVLSVTYRGPRGCVRPTFAGIPIVDGLAMLCIRQAAAPVLLVLRRFAFLFERLLSRVSLVLRVSFSAALQRLGFADSSLMRRGCVRRRLPNSLIRDLGEALHGVPRDWAVG